MSSVSDPLLTLIQTAAGELFIPVPSYVVSNPDPQTKQLLAMANKTGRDLIKMHTWSVLTVIYPFLTVANQELYKFPADFDRMIGSTQWDDGMHWELLGPDSPQIAAFRRESLISVASPRRIIRQEGNFLSVYPIDTVGGASLIYYYISRNWAITGAQAPTTLSQRIGVADTDQALYDTDLMVKGIKANFMTGKGMASAAGLQAEYIGWMKDCIAADLGGGEILKMGPSTPRWGNADVQAGNAVLNWTSSDFGPDSGN